VTEVNSWYSELESRPSKEAAIIVEAFAGRQIEIGGIPDPADRVDPRYADQDYDVERNGIAYMYAKGHLLTREQYLGGDERQQEEGKEEVPSVQRPNRPRGVLDILRQYRVTDVEVRRIVRDIVLLTWNPNRNEETPESSQASGVNDDLTSEGNGENSESDRATPKGRPPDVPFLLDRIDAELGVGIATPDQVLTAAQQLAPCSATEPQPVYPPAGPYPPICPDGGAKVRIFVADTGLVPGAATTFPWLAGVQGDPDPGNTGNGVILPYGGHGTFVAGVLRCLAPQARVHVEKIFDTGGSALESEVVTRLDAAFGFGFEILHLTASGMTRKNIPPVALEVWLDWLLTYEGAICVAPAGNYYTRRPSWPGAFPNVIAVGALDADWDSKADFSDYGGWVDVYAPGQNLVNAFGSGTYTYQIPPNAGTVGTFYGLAQWSGTSFSAPIVTGMIAARMARLGESAAAAATALLAEARTQAIPCVGPVLLPRCGGE